MQTQMIVTMTKDRKDAPAVEKMVREWWIDGVQVAPPPSAEGESNDRA